MIPLLFERVDPEDQPPFAWISIPVYCDMFLTVHGDIPFRQVPVILFEPTGDHNQLIDWAETHARLQATPLPPADDPLAAADAAINAWIVRQRRDGQPPLDGAGLDSCLNAMRHKGLRCISHLLIIDEKDPPHLGKENDAEWSRMKAECSRLGIRWSEEKQEYVATKGSAE